MRDIKFRAWHTTQHKMYDADELGHDQMTLSVDGRGFINVSGVSLERSTFAGEKMIPLQFTGLKDRNDKEIYEGDLLKGQRGNYPVSFHEGEARFHAGLPYAYLPTIDWWRYEVVGNIYENPELLEAK